MQSKITMPEPGDVWKHYKGGLYKILHLANNAAGQPEVVYTSADEESGVFVRPLQEFVQWLDKGEDKIPRFKFYNSASRHK